MIPDRCGLKEVLRFIQNQGFAQNPDIVLEQAAIQIEGREKQENL